jgi:PAS domain S-box-containing protein
VKEQTEGKISTLRAQRDDTLDELDKYKLLVDSVQDYAIFLLDAKGYIKTWNRGAEKNKGYKPEEIIGKHFSIFYMPEDVEAKKPEKELEIATQFGRAEDEDWRVRKDGSRFWASVVITALYNNGGRLVGFAKVTRDLTERKRHEDELRKANTLLKAQQQELKRLNQSKDEFISLASHQLRTPASAIKQLLGLFTEGFQPDISERHLALIRKAYESNERQINIVNSLLKVAQMDAGKVVLKMTTTNLTALVESVVDDFGDTVQSRQQSIELKGEPSIMVTADAPHLRMALENLISNASKYTYEHGSIAVSVARSGDFATVAIIDNGVGIAERDLKMLFEKFKRIPNDLSETVGGTGLGLYWANKVIALHGGHITVDSELHAGTTFTVHLPTGS